MLYLREAFHHARARRDVACVIAPWLSRCYVMLPDEAAMRRFRYAALLMCTPVYHARARLCTPVIRQDVYMLPRKLRERHISLP